MNFAVNNEPSVTAALTTQAVIANDANSKPQEAANGTKPTSVVVPAIKIDEANDNEKKIEKVVACKCPIGILELAGRHQLNAIKFKFSTFPNICSE